MRLLEMSAAGSALILAAVLVRSVGMNRLPKRCLLALWGIALARLLLPFRLCTPLSVWNLFEGRAPQAGDSFPIASVRPAPVATAADAAVRTAPLENVNVGSAPQISPWLIAYLIGFALCALVFVIGYVRWLRAFRESMPATDAHALEWLAAQKFHRRVALRRSDRISTPLTYGILRPVILLPRGMDGQGDAAIHYVLAHECEHIRRFDGALKWLLALAACVHWFNPLAWLMLTLANRDIELSCDEAVVRRFGASARADYALALIRMEEIRGGAAPLLSGFSRNAIEERIVAIMKFQKKSLLAGLLAILMILGVAAAFATSAEVKTAANASGEYAPLLAARFPNWEETSVAEFREHVLRVLDVSEEAGLLLDRAGEDAALQARRDSDADAGFLWNVLMPLAAENWRTRDFGGAVTANAGRILESAVLEYWGTIQIMDADALTAEAYGGVRAQVEAVIAGCLNGMTAEQLRNGESVEQAIFDAIDDYREKDCPQGLDVGVDLFYQPLQDASLTDVYSGRFGDTAREWDEVLSPYVPFGLRYEYNPDFNGMGLTMEFAGKNVRGIVDGGQWITEHAGTGFPEGSIELYAVRENGELTGLREATAEEAALHDQARSNAHAALRSETAESEAAEAETKPEPEREQRQNPLAPEEVYGAVLALRTNGWREASVADFNARVLECVNHLDQDDLDSLLMDIGGGEYRADLSDAEREFLALSFYCSNMENAAMVRARKKGGEIEDSSYGPVMLSMPSEDGWAWNMLRYRVSYRVDDPEGLTVGARDDCIRACNESVEAFWTDAGLEGLLRMSEAEVAEALAQIAEDCGAAGMTLRIDGDQVQFEHKDERELVYAEPAD